MKALNASTQAQSIVDWEALHERLDAMNARIQRDFAPAAEERKAIFQKRALMLAREAEAPKRSKNVIEAVEFVMAYEAYGIDVAYVREVAPLRELTPVPCVPPFVLGIVNIRGKIYSLVDLKKFFGLPEKGLADLNRVIVLGLDSLEFGVLADGVRTVRRVDLETLNVDFPTITGVRRNFLQGVTEDNVIILNAQAILSDPAIIVNAKEEL